MQLSAGQPRQTEIQWLSNVVTRVIRLRSHHTVTSTSLGTVRKCVQYDWLKTRLLCSNPTGKLSQIKVRQGVEGGNRKGKPFSRA